MMEVVMQKSPNTENYRSDKQNTNSFRDETAGVTRFLKQKKRKKMRQHKVDVEWVEGHDLHFYCEEYQYDYFFEMFAAQGWEITVEEWDMHDEVMYLYGNTSTYSYWICYLTVHVPGYWNY